VSRNVALAGIALLTACASASTEAPGTPPADAPAQTIDAPPPIDAMVDLCPSTSTCQAGMMLGAVSGDSGSQMLMTTGYQSAWYRVRVTEDSSNGIQLSLSATLTSPPGLDFDVFVYVNEGQDLVECTTASGTRTPNGAAETVYRVWGDTFASSDSRTVSIEVRPISGTCAPDKMWQLKLVGNT
jgi:hypothetical protein